VCSSDLNASAFERRAQCGFGEQSIDAKLHALQAGGSSAAKQSE
jgi:hypothetical protein